MTVAVIANSPPSRYAHPQLRLVGAGAWMTDDGQADLEARVRAGEWLRTGEAAKLLGIGRTKMHTLCASGRIGVRRDPGAAKRPPRRCNPADVLRLLEESRVEYRGDSGPASAVGADDAS
ncbi:helix-turn-helix domain-containing protein [Melissospora conviva]|uniref:helix-turn-helix domain-containing protein n=1 Tax=Melissospora conviva TaxID=3388432 RepID=UPI003C1FB621